MTAPEPTDEDAVTALMAATEDILDEEAMASVRADVIAAVQQLNAVMELAKTGRLSERDREDFGKWLDSESELLKPLVEQVKGMVDPNAR